MLKYFSNFSQKIGFDILCLEDVKNVKRSWNVKAYFLFSGENKKIITDLSSAEFACIVLKCYTGLKISDRIWRKKLFLYVI